MIDQHLIRARKAVHAMRQRAHSVRERLSSIPEPNPFEDLTEEITAVDAKVDAIARTVEVVAARPPQQSGGELVIDMAAKRSTLRAPPWVLAVAVVGVTVLGVVALAAWLATR